MRKPSVPSTILRSFELVPESVHATLLLRHSHRSPIKPGTYGTDVPLTTGGAHAAEQLGAVLGRRQLGRLLASPVGRCVDTAQALARGAGQLEEVTHDWRLGDPGPFVVDASLAGPMFLELGSFEVVRRQLVEPKPLPGMRPTLEGVALLLDLMMEERDALNALDVFVTHDAIIAVVVGHLLGVAPDTASWPTFLDGPFLWLWQGQLGVAWHQRLFLMPFG